MFTKRQNGKSLAKILDELTKVWNNLSQEEKGYIAKSLEVDIGDYLIKNWGARVIGE